MGKRNLLIIIALSLWSLGFSQNNKNTVKVYIGNLICDNKVEIPRSQFLNEGKFTIIVNDKDTVKSVTYTMQTLKGDDLSKKIVYINPVFTLRFKSYFKYNKYEAKIYKIWVENIKIDYNKDTLIVPSFTITLTD